MHVDENPGGGIVDTAVDEFILNAQYAACISNVRGAANAKLFLLLSHRKV